MSVVKEYTAHPRVLASAQHRKETGDETETHAQAMAQVGDNGRFWRVLVGEVDCRALLSLGGELLLTDQSLDR
jgi:hypothetical protein